jgi:ABC-type glycerol-3-phosphate transport system substrate-binding protein
MSTWGNRNSITVKWSPDASAADILLIPPTELGSQVATGELLPVPASIAAYAAPFQWTGLLGVYQTGLVRWGTKAYAVPLVAEGYVLVFRSDRLADPAMVKAFTEKHRRPPLPILTWEDLAEVAAVATQLSGEPSLPGLPQSAQEAMTQFGQIAACYDRSVGGGREKGSDEVRRGMSFLVSGETGDRRTSAPAFAETFRWFQATSMYRRKTPEDPVTALTSGSAVAAVLSLTDALRLPRDPQSGLVESRFGVAVVPGTRSYFDAANKPVPTTSPNFVPYYGHGGLVGTVRSKASAEACWRMLEELGNPAGSASTLDSSKIGCGPLRASHIREDVRSWRQYRFDEARTTELGKALSQYASVGAVNPALALRTPDQAAITELVIKHLRRVATGETTAAEALNQWADEWAAQDAKTPEAERRSGRRKSAGFE